MLLSYSLSLHSRSRSQSRHIPRDRSRITYPRRNQHVTTHITPLLGNHHLEPSGRERTRILDLVDRLGWITAGGLAGLGGSGGGEEAVHRAGSVVQARREGWGGVR
jgi:hypothetical protein